MKNQADGFFFRMDFVPSCDSCSFDWRDKKLTGEPETTPAGRALEERRLEARTTSSFAGHASCGRR